MFHSFVGWGVGVVLAILSAVAQAATVDNFPRATIAVVGGTFINDALLKKPGLVKGHFTVKTKVGESPGSTTPGYCAGGDSTIATIGDRPRVGDGLRMHPEMTSEAAH